MYSEIEEDTRLSISDDSDYDQSAPLLPLDQSAPPDQSAPRPICSWSDVSSCLKICLIYLLIVAIFTIIPVIAVATLIILILSFLVTRALQLFWHGDDYDKAVQLKVFIRLVMFLVTSLLAIVLGISYGIAKLIPGFKRAVILETPLEDWMMLIFLIYGIYMLHCVLSVCTFRFVPKIPLDRYQSGFNAPENVLEIIDCLIILLAVSQVEKRVPVFKADKIHGLCTRKWVEVTILVFLAYNVIVLLTRVIIANGQDLVTVLSNLFGINSKEQPTKEPAPGTDAKGSQNNNEIMHKIMGIRYVKYCAVGIKQSIDFILCSIVFLLTWVLYFRSHLEETPQAKRVLEVGTVSFATLLVCAILWFIKTYLLLLWEVRAVYNRLEDKIVKGVRLLYFLTLASRRNFFNTENDYSTNDEAGGREGGFLKRVYSSLFPDVGYNQKHSVATWKIVRGYLTKDVTSPSFYDLQQMAHCFLQARETLLEDDKYIHFMVASLKKQDSDDNTVMVIKDELNKFTEAHFQEKREQQQQQGGKIDYWKGFEILMSDEYVDSSSAKRREDSEQYYDNLLHQIKKGMERAHKRCLRLARTLSNAKELVRCLNNIISWLIIAATFILWLLLTGFATTQVFVLVASPLLAASFIFGDTCKTLFQGIIFVYVVQPFLIGDFCFIDGQQMEVKTIGVWMTTFSKVDMPEEVTYPTLTLLTKEITYKKLFSSWIDSIEFEVKHGSVNIKPTMLRECIEKYFKDESETFIHSDVNLSRARKKVTPICVTFTYQSEKDNRNTTQPQSPEDEEEKKKVKSNLESVLKQRVEQLKVNIFNWDDNIILEVRPPNNNESKDVIDVKDVKDDVEKYFKEHDTFIVKSSVEVSISENVTIIAVDYKINKDKMKRNNEPQCLKEKKELKFKVQEGLVKKMKDTNANLLNVEFSFK